MKNILVPTDFSEISDYGLHAAVQIAKKINAKINLVNLIAPPSGNTFSVTGDVTKTYATEEDRYVAQLLRVNKTRLDEIASAHAKDGIDTHIVLRVEPWQEGIKSLVQELNIDLIVMGTSGETSMTEYFVGNHTEQVIRVVDKPVLTVRDYIESFSVKNIVLATDLDVEAFKGIGHINSLAKSLGAHIHLLHVRESDNDEVSEVEEKLTGFAKTYNLQNYSIHSIKHSDKVEGIRKYSKINKADIIAVITHGRSGFSHMLKGSISESIIKEANIPVLTVNMD